MKFSTESLRSFGAAVRIGQAGRTRPGRCNRPTATIAIPALLLSALALAGCGSDAPPEETVTAETGMREQPAAAPRPDAEAVAERVADYAPFTLTADLGTPGDLSDDQRRMIGLLIDASKIMDDLFWRQAWGDGHEEWLADLPAGPVRQFARINYGPWDRLGDDRPFVTGVRPKPAGANFYPPDMTVEEFEAWDQPGKDGLYSLVRRDAAGDLGLIPYHEAYAGPLERAAELLREAAALADDEGLARYLGLRADALVTDDYQPSDMAWLDMKTNRIDVVIGAIETYEDQLFGYRAAYESFVLLKDMAWSDRLSRFTAFLPELQRGLPVPERYKAEEPGSDSDLNAYDALYYAGDANAGAKTIAINLPNDEEVQLAKGTRRLQLKNAMRAKFEKIMQPIAEVLIVEEQRGHVTFDAFFANTMFHEVAHGLGIKNTVDGSGTVRAALKDVASSIEEGKADVLGLYMITELHERGELGDVDLMDYYTTFLAGIFRSVRFGASSAHGKANMVRFNFFADEGAFTTDETTGRYRVDFEAMQAAITKLSAKILTLQGDGDYEGAKTFTDTLGVVRPELADALARVNAADIPVDVRFEQGREVLGL
ncbi:dipeptidyl-peptidase 3 family protein [Lentisalinibacter salinarum]|uniref:dipeptidyl-peptidase 3 family protein n=1 Tax=Lentisalinibacter salinarum TaxID=2992239 RepID=UPI0038706F6E